MYRIIFCVYYIFICNIYCKICICKKTNTVQEMTNSPLESLAMKLAKITHQKQKKLS